MGVPLHDDRKLFEFMVLDAFQAGLSWKTILNKRDNFRRAFDNFDADKISKYNESKYNDLLQDAGIIRNRAKIRGTIENAIVFLKIQQEFGSFDKYIWSFVNYKPVINHWDSLANCPQGLNCPISEQRHDQALFQICWLHDLLCIYAGRRSGE